jgi:hypothetical protein
MDDVLAELNYLAPQRTMRVFKKEVGTENKI